MRDLCAAGHDTTGIVRSPDAASIVRERGGCVLVADVLDREALLRAVEGRHYDAVVHQLTALKKPPTKHASMAATNTLRTTGSENLVAAAKATGARRFVTQSIVFGYGYVDHGSRFLAEDDPFGVPHGDRFDPDVLAMASAERAAIDSAGIEGVALRYGLLYGADLDSMARMLRRRAVPVARGGGEIPFVHHDDAAAATVAAMERGVPGTAYNIVDDGRVTFGDLIRAVATTRGTPKPVTIPLWAIRTVAPYAAAIFGDVSMRVSNRRAREELGWEPRYRTITQGVAAG